MTEDNNDMNSADQEKKLPASLDRQLRGLLPEKELNHFRDQLPEAFLTDAAEGLNEVRDGNQLDGILDTLNHQMHQQLTHKKRKKSRRSIRDFSWDYWAIIIVLTLCIAAFIVIRLILHR